MKHGSIGLMLAMVLLRPVPAGEVKETKSALEREPAGWINLLADKNLKDWKRVSIPPGSELRGKSPWSVDSAGTTLICDGVGVHEMLLYGKEFGDGIFHAEWRFKKLEGGKTGYNSGVYVRNSADGKIWHQAQVGSKNVGFMFGNTLVDGAIKRVKAASQVPQRGKEAGEWNVFEITSKGKNLTLWVNGAVTAEWTDCQVPRLGERAVRERGRGDSGRWLDHRAGFSGTAAGWAGPCTGAGRAASPGDVDA
jgi:hypothetical protein